jgi:hypothetical protein
VLGVGAVATLLFVLPRPGGGYVFASRTARWLIDYRLVASRERFHGRLVRGQCISTWFAPLTRAGRRVPGNFAVLSSGAQLFDSHRDLRLLRGRLPTTPIDQIDLAGCPRALALVVDRLITDRDHVATRPGRLEGHAVIELRLRRRVYLVAERSTGRPLGVVVDETHGVLRSELSFRPLTASTERALIRAYDVDRRRAGAQTSKPTRAGPRLVP